MDQSPLPRFFRTISALTSPGVAVSGSGGWITLTALVLMILPAQAAYAVGGLASQLVTPSAQEMTRSLTALNARYQHAAPAAQGALLAQLLDLAKTREQLLAALIEDEPATVLDTALSDTVRASLPPTVQVHVEQVVDTDGELEVAVEDRETHSLVHYTLKTNHGTRLALHFAADPPDLLTGSRVRVHGVQVSNALALSSGSTSVTTVSAALPNTFGAQKTVVLLVNFQDQTTRPYTATTAQSVVFTTTNNFYLESSYQQTWLTGDVFGWFTLPMSASVCDSAKLATYANQAATTAGVNLSNYSHYVYAFPQNACGWWGLGTVGGSPSQAWVNGSLELKVISHELGHNLGLSHSHSLDCGGATIGSNCTSIEYGDTIDTMGTPEAGHFNAFQKERLGWLNYGASPPITTVQASGTYVIDPYESLTANAKALKILRSTDPTTGVATWYYVEYRTALGFDAFLSGNADVLNGVVVHSGSLSDGNSCYLLDMTPSSPPSQDVWGGGDPALDVGERFDDLDAGVSITPVSVSSSGASVSITFGPVGCVAYNPTVTLSPAQSPGVMAGSTVDYTVSVTNNYSSGCSAANFNLQAGVPSGWTAAVATSTLTIAPGSTVSTIVHVTSATSAAAGSYSVSVGAVDASATTFSGQTSAVYLVVAATATPTPTFTPTFTRTPTVPAPTATATPPLPLSATPTATWVPTSTPTPGVLNVTVSTDQPSYTRNQTVTSTATVAAGAVPAGGASVIFTITRSNGTVVTGSVATAGNGVATYKMRLRKPDPVGTYQVRVNAALNGAGASATTSFSVQ